MYICKVFLEFLLFSQSYGIKFRTVTSSKFISEDKGRGEEALIKKLSVEKRRKGRRQDHRRRLRGARRRKNCKSGDGREPFAGAVVRCKSPSTAFNYDVIANTDDGYFLRYTLYITRAALRRRLPRARTKGRGGSVCVRLLRTNDQTV